MRALCQVDTAFTEVDANQEQLDTRHALAIPYHTCQPANFNLGVPLASRSPREFEAALV